ncbi:MAG: PIN domain-containing protein [Candidatus Lokiarchaeota archaeon]|nr:PIN domain-containing protein [Candidatus Lokiarchaeota archaeon]
MKVFLDSSFFFPFIRVDVKNISKKDIGNLLRNTNYDILCSELVYFELSAKGSKYIVQGILEMEDLLDGISFIHNFNKIAKIPIYHPEILILAQEFRKTHQDYIDCIILASAVKSSEIFITMDYNLKENIEEHWKDVISKENPIFVVKTLSDISKK